MFRRLALAAAFLVGQASSAIAGDPYSDATGFAVSGYEVVPDSDSPVLGFRDADMPGNLRISAANWLRLESARASTRVIAPSTSPGRQAG